MFIQYNYTKLLLWFAIHALYFFYQNNFLLLTLLPPATCHSWDHSNRKTTMIQSIPEAQNQVLHFFTYLYNTTVTTGWNHSKVHLDSFKSLNESDKQITLTFCFAAVQSGKTAPDILEVVIASLPGRFLSDI